MKQKRVFRLLVIAVLGSLLVIPANAWSRDGKTLTIQTNTVFDRQGETFEMKSTEVWTLEEEGKILTVQSDSTSPRGERSVKLVYDKK